MLATARAFDRGKPFYPLVMNYVVQLLGFKELALRGVIGPRELGDIVKQIPALGSVPPGKEADAAAVQEGLRKLMGPLQLRSEFLDATIDVEVDEMAREVASNSNYLASQLMRSAGSLLILAHELNKHEPWLDQGALWEFLRHCRNGSAHGGRFRFLNGEPRRPAVWGRFQITPAFEGRSVFKGTDMTGMLSQAIRFDCSGTRPRQSGSPGPSASRFACASATIGSSSNWDPAQSSSDLALRNQRQVPLIR